MHPDHDWPTAHCSSQHTLNGLTLRVEQCGSEPAYDLTFRRDNLTTIEIGRSPNQASINEYKKVYNHGGKAMFRCPVVSRKHAKITFTPSGQAYVLDLGSHHGTYILKGYGSMPSKVSSSDPVRLDDGDYLTFGKTVGRDEKMVPPIVTRVELLYTSPSDNTFPFFYGATKGLKRRNQATPPPAGSIHKSPSTSSGRYGLKTDLDGASSSSEQGSSDMEDSSPAKSPKPAVCYPAFDWKGVFSKLSPPAAAEGEEAMHFDFDDPPAPALPAADVTHDVGESDSPIPGSFPNSQSQGESLRSYISSFQAGQRPASPEIVDTPDFGGDMDLETPAPEERSPSPVPATTYQADLKEVKEAVEQLKTELLGLDFLRGVVTANQRAGASKYVDLGDRMERLETDIPESVQKLTTDIRHLYDENTKVTNKALDAQMGLMAQGKDLRMAHDEITGVYSQLDELRDMIEGLEQEREDVVAQSRQLQDDIANAEELVGDLETLHNKTAGQIQELSDLHRKCEVDFAEQRASIEDARKAALADIEAASAAAIARIAQETETTLKRKRSESESIEEFQESQVSEIGSFSQRSAEESVQRPPKRARRIMSTAGAVTVGAVATWSALAFA